MKIFLHLFFIILFSFQFLKTSETSQLSHKKKDEVKEWILTEIIKSTDSGLTLEGDPEIIECPWGKALRFDGEKDGVFIDTMPLNMLHNFTIETIFFPESQGKYEQRFFHSGEVSGNRVLLETRSDENNWWFDAYIQSNEQKKALADPELTHPLDQWYHLAYVVSNGFLETYVNGKKELESQIDFIPLKSGTTSIGVRLNKVSWFKGAIYKIRITPKKLNPTDFMQFHM